MEKNEIKYASFEELLSAWKNLKGFIEIVLEAYNEKEFLSLLHKKEIYKLIEAVEAKYRKSKDRTIKELKIALRAFLVIEVLFDMLPCETVSLYHILKRFKKCLKKAIKQAKKTKREVYSVIKGLDEYTERIIKQTKRWVKEAKCRGKK